MGKRTGILLIAGLIGFLLSGVLVCYAGDVNSAEQQVISAASGTFTYEGATYRAYPEYVSQLTGYFARDDVNLSQSEVSGLISDMNGSVKDAIDSGYLYMVSPAPNSSDSASEASNDSDSDDGNDDSQTVESDDTKHTDKKFDIEQSMKESKMFYKTDTTSTTVDMVIKNTGYNISNVIYIAAAMLALTALVVVLTIRYDLFAPVDES